MQPERKTAGTTQGGKKALPPLLHAFRVEENVFIHS